MACAFYCLIRHPEQLDPLVDRLRDAGVRNENIAVVLLKGAGMFSSNLGEATRLAQAFWDFSICTTLGLWWPLAMCGWLPCSRAAGNLTVVPLDLYRARRS